MVLWFDEAKEKPRWDKLVALADDLVDRITIKPLYKKRSNPHLLRTQRRVQELYTWAIALYPNKYHTDKHGKDLFEKIRLWSPKVLKTFKNRFQHFDLNEKALMAKNFENLLARVLTELAQKRQERAQKKQAKKQANKFGIKNFGNINKKWRKPNNRQKKHRATHNNFLAASVCDLQCLVKL